MPEKDEGVGECCQPFCSRSELSEGSGRHHRLPLAVEEAGARGRLPPALSRASEVASQRAHRAKFLAGVSFPCLGFRNLIPKFGSKGFIL